MFQQTSAGTGAEQASETNATLIEPKERMRRLIELSQNVDVDFNIPVNKYIRSGNEMVKRATSHEEQGELEKAFILYLRFVSLFLEKLIKHPGYSKLELEDKTAYKAQCNVIFDRAEKVKAILLEKYSAEYNSK